jgi:hypothetical protein
MVSFYNELPLTSLTYTPHSARIAVTYLSQVIGLRGTESSFFCEFYSTASCRYFRSVYVRETLTQFPMVSMNRSRLVAPLDNTYKDPRYDYVYTQLLGATHNYHTLQRAFKRWNIFFFSKQAIPSSIS